MTAFRSVFLHRTTAGRVRKLNQGRSPSIWTGLASSTLAPGSDENTRLAERMVTQFRPMGVMQTACKGAGARASAPRHPVRGQGPCGRGRHRLGHPLHGRSAATGGPGKPSATPQELLGALTQTAVVSRAGLRLVKPQAFLARMAESGCRRRAPTSEPPDRRPRVPGAGPPGPWSRTVTLIESGCSLSSNHSSLPISAEVASPTTRRTVRLMGPDRFGISICPSPSSATRIDRRVSLTCPTPAGTGPAVAVRI